MALVGFIVIALGEIFAEPMLAALNVPAETMPLASLYLRVFLLSMPSILLYNFEAAIFRSVGITRMPLQALAVSTVLNIGLDLIFVPVLHWGVAGVAIATAIAYTVSAATLFIRLLKTDSVVRVTPRDLAIDPVALKRIVKIGLPAGIQSAVFAVANIIIQSAINSLGTEVMAASSAAMESFCMGVHNSFCKTAYLYIKYIAASFIKKRVIFRNKRLLFYKTLKVIIIFFFKLKSNRSVCRQTENTVMCHKGCVLFSVVCKLFYIHIGIYKLTVF